MMWRWRGMAGLGLAVFLAACGGEQPGKLNAPEAGFQRAAHWEPMAPGVSEAPADAAATAITLGAAAGYQAQHSIMTNGRTLLILRYDISVGGGPAYLGVLTSDRSAWLKNIPLEADERAVGEEYLPVDGDNVFLVIQTMSGAAQPTVLTIRDMQYALE